MGINCISQGYLYICLSVKYGEEIDSVQLKHGERTSPEYWNAPTDSVIITYNDRVFILSLIKAEFYSTLHPDADLDKKEGLFLTMDIH